MASNDDTARVGFDQWKVERRNKDSRNPVRRELEVDSLATFWKMWARRHHHVRRYPNLPPESHPCPTEGAGRGSSGPGRPAQDRRGRISDDFLHAEGGSGDRRQVPGRSSQGERHGSQLAPAYHGSRHQGHRTDTRRAESVEFLPPNGSTNSRSRSRASSRRSGGESRSRTAPSTSSTNTSRRRWAGRTPISTSSRSAAFFTAIPSCSARAGRTKTPPVNSLRTKVSKIVPADGKRFQFRLRIRLRRWLGTRESLRGLPAGREGNPVSAVPGGRTGLPTRRRRRHLRLRKSI